MADGTHTTDCRCCHEGQPCPCCALHRNDVTQTAAESAAIRELDATVEGLNHMLDLIGESDYQEACERVASMVAELAEARDEIATMRAVHDSSVEAVDIIGEYPHTPRANDTWRVWWTGGTWLRPGECVAVLPRAVVAMQERKP